MSDKRKAFVALLLLLNDKEKNSKKSRSIWVKNIYKRRKEKGSYENLIKELALEDSENYRRYLRMDTTTFLNIVESIKHLISNNINSFRPDVISPEEKVAITLRFLATGDSYQSIKFAFRVSPPEISFIISQVCDAIYSVLGPQHLKVPTTQSEWQVIATQFNELWNFPNCIGALDGKHVLI